MTKIQDIPYGVLFEFIVTKTEKRVLTTLIEDILTIENKQFQKIDGLFVGQQINLSDGVLYTIEEISIGGLSSNLQNFEFGYTEHEIRGTDKEYLFTISIRLR